MISCFHWDDNHGRFHRLSCDRRRTNDLLAAANIEVQCTPNSLNCMPTRMQQQSVGTSQTYSGSEDI